MRHLIVVAYQYEKLQLFGISYRRSGITSPGRYSFGVLLYGYTCGLTTFF